jgi:hypothetical protein
MGIGNSIKRVCRQNAVYWGNPKNDGEGGFTYDTPIQIKCRWEDRNETFVTPLGEQAVSKSVVYILQKVDQDGYLFLGTLDELYDEAESSGALLDPKVIEGAYLIKRFDKIPAINPSDGYLQKAFLTSKNMV